MNCNTCYATIWLILRSGAKAKSMIQPSANSNKRIPLKKMYLFL